MRDPITGKNETYDNSYDIYVGLAAQKLFALIPGINIVIIMIIAAFINSRHLISRGVEFGNYQYRFKYNINIRIMTFSALYTVYGSIAELVLAANGMEKENVAVYYSLLFYSLCTIIMSYSCIDYQRKLGIAEYGRNHVEQSEKTKLSDRLYLHVKTIEGWIYDMLGKLSKLSSQKRILLVPFFNWFLIMLATLHNANQERENCDDLLHQVFYTYIFILVGVFMYSFVGAVYPSLLEHLHWPNQLWTALTEQYLILLAMSISLILYQKIKGFAK